MLKADFHIHSSYSMDCTTPPEDIINRCLETGINCITISDHDALEGALKIQGMAPFTVIAAEEILTPNGEIMGMFLKERIPSGVSIEQAISSIKAQDGLVCIPHPFDSLRGLRIDTKRFEELATQIDVMEIFNARSLLPLDSNKAREFAKKHNIPGTAGSDAHSTGEIGHTYVEMPDFTGKDNFLQALRKGKIHKQLSNPLVHFNSTWAKIKKSL